MHDSMQRDDGGWQVRMQTKLPGWTLMTRSDPVQLVQALQTKASSSSSSCFTLGRSQFPGTKSEKRGRNITRNRESVEEYNPNPNREW